MLGDRDLSSLSVSPDMASTGPYIDELEGYRQAYNAHTKASAQMGMTESFAEKEAEQIRWLHEQGEISIPALSEDFVDEYLAEVPRPFAMSGNYKDVYRYYGGEESPEVAKRLQDYDLRIEDMRKKYPQRKFMNSREMFDSVVRDGVEAEARVSSSRGGGIGKFVGEAVASLNPSTDPINAATLMVGGAGSTALKRILSQFGAQSAVESLNQVLGVQEQRRIMGLSSGWRDALSRVAMAGVGGAMVQGGGEAIGAAVRGGKRWFADAPETIKPPVAAKVQITPEMTAAGRAQITAAIQRLDPLTRTPEGRARATQDLDYMASRLDAWGGEAPVNLRPPRADTALPRAATEDFISRPEMTATPYDNVDVVARKIDPQTFEVFDRLSEQKIAMRAQLDAMRPESAGVREQIDDISDRIDNLRNKVERNSQAGTRRATAQSKRLEEMVQEREALMRQSGGEDTPPMRAVREELQRIDYKMRDMYPQVTRAYTQARGEWSASQSMHDRVSNMIRSGRKELPPARVAETAQEAFERIGSPEDAAPILVRAPSVASKIPQGADNMTVAQIIAKQDSEVLNETIEAFRASINKVLKGEEPVTVPGYESKLNMSDEIITTNKDGTGQRKTTVREMLAEHAETEEDLKAIKSCSI